MKQFKKILPYALLVISVLVILQLWESKISDRESLESVIAQKSNEFKIRTTADSLHIASQERARVTSANDVSKYYAKEIASLKEDLGGKIDRVNSMVRASFLISTHGKVKTVIIKDSTKQELPSGTTDLSALYVDKHFTIGVKIGADTAIFNPIKYSGTFTGAGFIKKRFLRKDEYYFSAYLDDKNANITGLTNFEVKEFKDKRWFAGPAIGYDALNNRMSVGVVVGYGIFKF